MIIPKHDSKASHMAAGWTANRVAIRSGGRGRAEARWRGWIWSGIVSAALKR
jgi:hypothetical protein